MVWPVLTAALWRALGAALVLGIIAYGKALGADDSQAQAISDGIVVAGSALALRFGLEGSWDSFRANTGKQSSGDVPNASEKLVVTERYG